MNLRTNEITDPPPAVRENELPHRVSKSRHWWWIVTTALLFALIAGVLIHRQRILDALSRPGVGPLSAGDRQLSQRHHGASDSA
jgi:hypothetical protein